MYPHILTSMGLCAPLHRGCGCQTSKWVVQGAQGNRPPAASANFSLVALPHV